MYSEYTVRERAIATVAHCVVASVQYVLVYTVSERGVATVIKLCRDVCTICIRCIELVKEQ